MSGKFFGLGPLGFSAACRIGLDAACAYILLASGTGKDHRSTSWSADSVRKRLGMRWMRARLVIGDMVDAGILQQEYRNGKPKYRMMHDEDGRYAWMPASLINGVATGGKSPIRLLFEAGNIDLLKTFVALYEHADLPRGGGVAAEVLCRPHRRIGRCPQRTANLNWWRFEDEPRKIQIAPYVLEDLGQSPEALAANISMLERMKLVRWTPSVFSADPGDGALLLSVSGPSPNDPVAAEIAGKIRRAVFEGGVERPAGELVMPVGDHVEHPEMVDVLQLLFRPDTRDGAEWVEELKGQMNHLADLESPKLRLAA